MGLELIDGPNFLLYKFIFVFEMIAVSLLFSWSISLPAVRGTHFREQQKISVEVSAFWHFHGRIALVWLQSDCLGEFVDGDVNPKKKLIDENNDVTPRHCCTVPQ